MAYPKPDDQRVTRHPQKFGWVDLPSRRDGAAPKLPPLRKWSAATRRWWRELWTTPQSTQWDQSGRTAIPMAVLWQDMTDADPAKTPAILAELRQHQDRHGLSPKAMLQLRWRISADTAAATTTDASVSNIGDRRAAALRMMTGAS